MRLDAGMGCQGAFIYNPEILVVHTPGMYFNKDHKMTIISLLREFVAHRGLEMDYGKLEAVAEQRAGRGLNRGW